MARSQSKAARMAAAISEARSAMDALREKLENVNAIREEFQEWFDAMNENWQQGDKGQEVEAIANVDTDADGLLSEVESALDELAGYV